MKVGYGTTHEVIAWTKEEDLACSDCNTKNTTTLNLYSNYIHMMGIPFFPIAKKGVSSCESCGHEAKDEDITGDTKEVLNTLKKNTLFPTKHFTFSILFGLLFAFAIGISIQKSLYKGLDKIDNPVMGERYVFEMEDGTRKEWEITAISADSISFEYYIWENEDFTEYNVTLSKANILEKKKNKQLIKINPPF